MTEPSFSVSPPTNPLVNALLTDLYQLTMAYAHWKNGRHLDPSVFDLFFRKHPFGGEYTIFAGLDECLKFLTHFSFLPSDIAYLQSLPALADCDPAFFAWLLTLNARDVQVWAVRDGTVVFPRIPLLQIQAPLGIAQLIETTLLTLVNYPTLLTTNAARMVRAAQSPAKKPIDCFEFGLRRAQGPDGGFSASKYACMGGFAGTSNVLAGKYFGLQVTGTHAHAFVQAYSKLDQVKELTLQKNMNATNVSDDGTSTTTTPVVLLPLVLTYREQLAKTVPQYATTNDGELAAFVAYAIAFPKNFLCLIDTYDTLKSGLPNFILVALALHDLGYVASGVRLDSGDLAYLSAEVAKAFAEHATERPFFADLSIVASNDINEAVLHAINKQDHAITAYGIGTNLVTCEVRAVESAQRLVYQAY
jgi:nicotinate phosphoribosyltransferase